MDPVTIIKLGGSLVTHPQGPDGAHVEVLEQLAGDLACCPTPLILVHGTGWVGKPFAVKHGYAETGILSADQAALGEEIRHDLYRLHHRITAILAAAGLSIAPLDTRHLFAPNGTDLLPEGLSKLRDTLSGGYIPLLTGDHLLQPDGSQRVFSSDTIVFRLAEELPTRSCLLLTNVDGVLSPRGEVLTPVAPGDLERLSFHQSDQQDVSGGMGGKLTAAFRAASAADLCMIGNGHCPGLLREWFDGNLQRGSRIVPGGEMA